MANLTRDDLDMKNTPTPKTRRSLPTPPSPPVQRPNTPVQASAASPTYPAQADTPPPLPTRPKGVGSATTTVYMEQDNPPSYGSIGSPTFREPELVKEKDELTYPTIGDPTNVGDSWHTDSDNAFGWPNNVYDSYNPNNYNWPNAWEPMPAAMSDWGTSESQVIIDNRDQVEETEWWDPHVRETKQRPGPGMLPSVLAEELHDSDHALYSVTTKNPTIQPSQSSGSSSSLSPFPPPNDEEVRHAVPHPNAYYCPKENGWLLLSWKSSSVLPPLVKSPEQLVTEGCPLPDQSHRRRTDSCIGQDALNIGGSNKTHHFHHYPRAIDAHKLTVPYHVDSWEASDTVKRKRRDGLVLPDDVKVEERGDAQEEGDEVKEQEQGMLLDLFMCCQCSFYCVVTPGVIPGVIPANIWNDFIAERKANPKVGSSPDHAVAAGIETFLLTIENALWRQESRMIKVFRPAFQKKLGWSPSVEAIFDHVGFRQERLDTELVLRPPLLDPKDEQSLLNRKRLLRAWVEAGAWLTEYTRNHASEFKNYTTQHELWVTMAIAREDIWTAIGSHPDQMPRGNVNDTVQSALSSWTDEWRTMGLTFPTYSADFLAFAYLAQCRCDPKHTVLYFTILNAAVELLHSFASCPQVLTDLNVVERSRGRFTKTEFDNAVRTLGFGSDNVLRMDYEVDLPDTFVEEAWKAVVKKSWKEQSGTGGELQREATDAFRILAEARGSRELYGKWQNAKDSSLMHPDRAYEVLEVPKDVDETMLITVFTMRLEEQPLQEAKMREALLVIAEVRDSERLMQFATSGQDPGDLSAQRPLEWPRGINQLGNTCYLNSLLQYFYTIKDLRNAVQQMGKLDLKSAEDEKLSDDDLKRHRVGGRLVTRREIVRSKKFLYQLANLFQNLMIADNASVTPTIELAKLALVTSQDEEDEEEAPGDKCGTDSSNDTDATLVDDGPSRFSSTPAPAATPTPETVPTTPAQPASPPSPARSPGSILGKRSRNVELKDDMDVDSPDITSLTRSKSGSPANTAGPSKEVDQDGDIQMRSRSASPAKKPPPLPPRRSTQRTDSVMMFGRQHDVSECMDNCMFQIETALLKFDEVANDTDEGSDKTSVVKRLFYGRLRQNLGLPANSDKGKKPVEPKVDIFSHLLVNVAEESFDIHDGLGRFFDDVVEYEGEYVPMQVSLVDLPPLLQIQLQRVQFDRDTLQSWKSQAYVKFEETIYMDRYMEDADPEKRSRSKTIQQELDACRERINLLTRGKVGSIPAVLSATSEFVAKNEDNDDVDDELVFDLNEEHALVQTEIDELRQRVTELKDSQEAIWKDATEVAYELTSVFIHRGTSPSWGHYFFYARNVPANPDQWFKYNDSDVSLVSRDEVLADTTHSTANPYLLVYARKGMDVVDTVCRLDPSASAESSMQAS